MSKTIFLYKENSNDRDAVAYINIIPSEFECNHYFSRVSIQGACYSGGSFADYENIKTILTEAEYNQLLQFAEDIENLGFGIVKGDERYQKGLALIKDIQPVYNRLLSEENEELFEDVQEEEAEFLMDEYGLDEDDLTAIFDKYYLDYRDRAVVGCVYKDAYDLGENEAISLGLVDWKMDDITSRYFDFEKFGEDLTEEESYCELPDGRIAYLCY